MPAMDLRRRQCAVEAVASELEELRNVGRKMMCRTKSLSPPRVPPCEESSQSSSSSDEEQYELERALLTGSEKRLSRWNTFCSHDEREHRPFPSACLRLLRSLPGNTRCVDCGGADPQWASVSYGVLLCLQCCGRHRSLGVRTSFVRSIAMDSWSHPQVLSMLEGGNDQLSQFFERHSLSSPRGAGLDPWSSSSGGAVDEIIRRRYKTKAALFYREQLTLHVGRVVDGGRYRGREESRKQSGVRGGGDCGGRSESAPHLRSKSLGAPDHSQRRRSRRLMEKEAAKAVSLAQSRAGSGGRPPVSPPSSMEAAKA